MLSGIHVGDAAADRDTAAIADATAEIRGKATSALDADVIDGTRQAVVAGEPFAHRLRFALIGRFVAGTRVTLIREGRAVAWPAAAADAVITHFADVAEDPVVTGLRLMRRLGLALVGRFVANTIVALVLECRAVAPTAGTFASAAYATCGAKQAIVTDDTVGNGDMPATDLRIATIQRAGIAVVAAFGLACQGAAVAAQNIAVVTGLSRLHRRVPADRAEVNRAGRQQRCR
jgi:hypothetical protein